MNRGVHPSQLQPNEYPFALNANTSNQIGDELNITNEPSNDLTVVFPEGYKVLGYKKDLVNNKTYYLLTNPTTRKSSIGYVENTVLEFYNQDEEVDCTDCKDNYNALGVPKELDGQVPTHNYIELTNDLCHNIGEGFNFDINHPIKSIEIKVEKSGVFLYFNDYLNLPRWIKVSDVSYLYTQEVPCADDIQVNCPLIYKLLQFPQHKKIVIDVDTLQTGGNLKLGTYEFYASYSDLYGNEVTNYCTPTNPISIFDENNNILDKTELDSLTNFAIKLKFNDLDTNFKYYKVVCVERNNVNKTQSTFVAGIYPTTNDTVLYTTSGSTNDDSIATGNASIKRRLDFTKITKVRPIYSKAKGDVASGGKKFMWGLNKRPEVNLQPVVNLFSSLLKWGTSIAKEDLYTSAIATSKYKGFMRDEVQPFSLRFYFKDGDYTANFPMVARPAMEGEKDAISDVDLNKASLDQNTPNCAQVTRDQRWQIFNTATVDDGYCEDLSGGIEVQEDVERSCTIDSVAEVPANTTIINIDNDFVDLTSYINENYDDVTNPASPNYIPEIAPYLVDTYPSIHCPDVETLFQGVCDTPLLDSSHNTISTIDYTFPNGSSFIIGNYYIINNLIAGDDFSNIGFLSEGHYFQATGTTPTTWTNGTVVLLQESVLIESIFPTEYARVKPPKYCTLYRNNNEGTPGLDYLLMTQFMECGEIAYNRDFQFTNTECAYAEVVQAITNLNDPIQGYFHNVDGRFTLAELQTTKDTTAISTGWTNKIHYGALWFKIPVQSNPRYLLELSKINDPAGSDNVSDGQVVRMTIYNKCNSTTPLYVDLVDLAVGEQYILEKIGTTLFITDESGTTTNLGFVSGNNLIVAIDTKIVPGTGYTIADGICTNLSDIRYRTAPADGCFSIVTREIEYSSAKVSWNSIKIDKTETYTSTCTYNLPKVQDCVPKAYQKGEFAYWESINTYPDNRELYDSSNLTINIDDLLLLENEDIGRFLTFFGDLDSSDNVVFKTHYDPLTDSQKSDANFTCEPIRHYKFPNNTVSPFMSDINGASFSEGIIFPMGIMLDNNIVKAMLQVALKNNLITSEEFSNIEGYEIMKGDNTISKSIIANGLSYDMYEYNQKNKQVLYANYPHNDLGADLYHCTDATRTTLIQHPHEGVRNNRFSFLSPDLAYNKIAIPNEMVISGYQLGKSKTIFSDVDEHPKWTILGRKARSTANTLANAEVALEIAIGTANIAKEINLWITAGTSGGTNAAGVAAQLAALSAYLIAAAQGAFVNKGRYRYEWLKIFEDLGASHNFANYSVSTGYHSNFLKNIDEDNYVRGVSLKKHLKSGDYAFRDEGDGSTGKTFYVNNFLRERSTFLSIGNHYFNYSSTYAGYDNNTIAPQVGSRTILSQNGRESGVEHIRNVGSPYVTLRNYVPDQFGNIDSISWLSMNYIKDLNEDTQCKTILGGNVCISRYSEVRKVPIFRKNIVGTADRIAFNYSDYKNIGFPRFYCDYKSDTEYNIAGIPFPDIDSAFNFDCLGTTNKFYIKPPAKMYLSSYGVTSFLVESEINCNFRYAGKQLKEGFYPQAGDVVTWTQEKNVSIAEQRDFRYNNVYSLPVSKTPYRLLDNLYSKNIWALRDKQDNAVIYSESDNSENSYSDPWLIYKPLNWYEFPTKYGKLIELKALDGNQILGRFENQQVIFNSIDNLADRITPQNKELGTAGIFTSRPLEFQTTDLGFAGTQHTDSLSTKYGVVTVDAKRGQIFLQSGKNIQPISESFGGKPNGMKQWFKEQLPFKILRQYPQIDIDNKFKGIGISMGWDDKHDRIFITKRDYTAINTMGLLYDENIGFYTQNELSEITQIMFDDSDYFVDNSWTIACNLAQGVWNSYFSFTPDYYVSNFDNFQVGYNWGQDRETMWSHLMGNKSYQVFQGRLYPFIIEAVVPNENANKFLDSISLNVEAKRYQSQWDYSQWRGIGFNKAIIYNNTQNSGVLNLVEQKTISDVRNYPKTNFLGTEQDILYTSKDGKHTFNYFYNRVINQQQNIPNWLWDINMVNKTINPKAVTFKGIRPILERLIGEYHIVRLINDKESRFEITLKNTINTETFYE